MLLASYRSNYSFAAQLSLPAMLAIRLSYIFLNYYATLPTTDMHDLENMVCVRKMMAGIPDLRSPEIV